MKDYFDYLQERMADRGGGSPEGAFYQAASPEQPEAAGNENDVGGLPASAYWSPPGYSAPPANYTPPAVNREEIVSGRAAAQQRGGVSAGPATPGEVEKYIREAATKRGMDPEIALAIAMREGGTDKREGNTGNFKTGRSHWAFQLHYGGAGTPYASWGDTAGMGNDFTAATGIQPGDPNGYRQAIDFALDRALKSGWQPWYGRQAAPARGLREIGVWEGIPHQ